MPGTRIRFGWDSIIGLIPGAGDVITGLLGSAIVLHAHRLRVPRVVQLRMLMNIAVDLALGAIPLAGDAVDVFWKSNTRNMALLERHAGGGRKPSKGDWAFVVGVIAIVLLLAALPLLLVAWVVAILVERGLL